MCLLLWSLEVHRRDLLLPDACGGPSVDASVLYGVESRKIVTDPSFAEEIPTPAIRLIARLEQHGDVLLPPEPSRCQRPCVRRRIPFQVESPQHFWNKLADLKQCYVLANTAARSMTKLIIVRLESVVTRGKGVDSPSCKTFP